MCLLSNSKKPLIAKEDIICYKVLQRLGDNTYVSPFRNVKYNINDFNYPLEKYNQNDYVYNDCIWYKIEQGFLHCFVSQNIDPNDYVSSSIFMYAKIFPLYIFECYIPKGAKYFISRCKKEICTNKLFVKDVKFKID